MERIHISKIGSHEKSLIEASITARSKSYSPYSKFSVGAALECEDGTLILGANIENSSFGLTICAERTAIAKAVSEGHTKFRQIAVSAVNKSYLVSPCGACRQTLAEFNPRLRILLHSPETGEVGITTLEHLLPESFNPENFQVL